MSKKIFPGLVSSIIEGVPALIGIVKPFLKKKKISDDELNNKTKEELFNIVKEHQTADDEQWYIWLLKRGVTLATVYFVVWTSQKLGVTGQSIIDLFGLLK